MSPENNRKRSAPSDARQQDEQQPPHKRAQQQRRGKTEKERDENAGDDQSDADTSTLSYEWIPSTAGNEAVRLRWNNQATDVILRRGDTVRLLTTSEYDCWICRVESLSNGIGNGIPTFRGRWFYRADDVQDLLSKSKNDDEETVLQDLLAMLKDGELVLSNLEEDNEISAIQHVCKVVYSSKAAQADDRNSYMCRFGLDWDASLQSFSTREIKPDEDAAPESYSESSSGERNSSIPNDADNTQDGDDEDSMDDDDSASTSPFSHVIQEGEGGALRGDILVGDNHQVKVGPFVPGLKVASRNPVLVYKPGCMSEEDQQDFADTLAEFHTQYLHSHQLTTTEEPYTPLTTQRAEALLKQEKKLTGSSLSSSSIFLGGKRSSLRKECDVDAVLQVLAEHNYDKNDAMNSIKVDPDFISNSWSPTEREIFDESYSRHQGNLREVAKALAPTKNMKQVIDYFYRFKIPDQFRLFRDKKRQQAIRLIETIEKRRGNISATTSKDDDDAPATRSRWQDTSVDDTAQTLSRRRKTAKKILVEIDAVMGKDVLTEIAVGVQKLRSSYNRETKDKLLQLLSSQPDLQRRLLEFLPRDV